MTGSETEHAPSKDVIVLDFLYHDARRVGSFLSQFHHEGVLQSSRLMRGSASTISNKQTMGGEFSLKILTGKGSSEGNESSEDRDSAERVYDPLWTNALNLLEHLTAEDLLVRDLNSARIGQFIQVTGEMNIVDLGMLKVIWSMAAARREIVKAGSDPGPNLESRAGRKAARQQPSVKSEAEENAEAAMQLVSAMPHMVQAKFRTESGSTVWCSVKEDSLVSSSADLLLKHGVGVQGTWNVIGVLDALPEVGPDGEATDEAMAKIERAGLMADSPLSNMVFQMTLPMRHLLGRGLLDYGVTPLMIFRAVNVPSNENSEAVED